MVSQSELIYGPQFQQAHSHEDNESFTHTTYRLKSEGRDLTLGFDRNCRRLYEVLRDRRQCQAQIGRLQEEVESSRPLTRRLEVGYYR